LVLLRNVYPYVGTVGAKKVYVLYLRYVCDMKNTFEVLTVLIPHFVHTFTIPTPHFFHKNYHSD